MRKWMRERMKRRKRSEQKSGEAAPAPLQPAYFDAGPVEAPAEEKPEPVREEAPAVDESSAAEPSQVPAAGSSRRRRRRRRGGRGGAKGAQSQAASGSEAAPIAAPTPPPAPAPPAVAEEVKPARPPRGVVVLAIGLPGSGKSSWFKRHNITALSSDLLRALLFDDAQEQRYQDLVFSNLRSMLKARLIARRPMNYVDATNLSPHERHGWIKLAKDYGYEVQAVFFDVPVEVCMERNQRRQRQVPEDVMRRMAAKLRAPSFEEGFAKITVVRVKKKDA